MKITRHNKTFYIFEKLKTNKKIKRGKKRTKKSNLLN